MTSTCAGEVGLGLAPRSWSTGRSRRRSPGRRTSPEALPDRDDLGVVGDGAEHERSSRRHGRAPHPNSGRPQSGPADEVLQRVGGRRHHRRRPGRRGSDARCRRPCGTPRRRRPASRASSTVERGLAGRRPWTAASAAARRPGPSPARRSRRRRASTAASAAVLHARRRAGGRRAGRRASGRGARTGPSVTWPIAFGDRGVHQPEAARRVEDLEHRQHRRRARCRGRRRRRRAAPSTGTRTPTATHRARGVAPQPEAVERRRRPSARRCRRARATAWRRRPRPTRPARPHVGVGLAGRRHPALRASSTTSSPSTRRGAERRPELAARARSRRTPASTGARRRRSPGARRRGRAASITAVAQ